LFEKDFITKNYSILMLPSSVFFYCFYKNGWEYSYVPFFSWANCNMLHAGYMRDLSFVEVYFRRLSWNLSNLHWNLHFQLFQVYFADESQYQVSGLVHVRHVHVQLIENHRLQLIEKKVTLYSAKFLYYVIFALSFLGNIFPILCNFPL